MQKRKLFIKKKEPPGRFFFCVYGSQMAVLPVIFPAVIFLVDIFPNLAPPLCKRSICLSYTLRMLVIVFVDRMKFRSIRDRNKFAIFFLNNKSIFFTADNPARKYISIILKKHFALRYGKHLYDLFQPVRFFTHVITSPVLLNLKKRKNLLPNGRRKVSYCPKNCLNCPAPYCPSVRAMISPMEYNSFNFPRLSTNACVPCRQAPVITRYMVIASSDVSSLSNVRPLYCSAPRSFAALNRRSFRTFL